MLLGDTGVGDAAVLVLDDAGVGDAGVGREVTCARRAPAEVGGVSSMQCDLWRDTMRRRGPIASTVTHDR